MNGLLITQNLASASFASSGKNFRLPGTQSSGEGFSSLLNTMLGGDSSAFQLLNMDLKELLLLLNQQLGLATTNQLFQLPEGDGQISEEQFKDWLNNLQSLLSGTTEISLDEGTDTLNMLAKILGVEDIDPTMWEQMIQIPSYMDSKQLEAVLDSLLQNFESKPVSAHFSFNGFNASNTDLPLSHLKGSQQVKPEQLLVQLVQLLKNNQPMQEVNLAKQSVTLTENTGNLPANPVSNREQAIVKLMALLSKFESGEIKFSAEVADKAQRVLSHLITQNLAGQKVKLNLDTTADSKHPNVEANTSSNQEAVVPDNRKVMNPEQSTNRMTGDTLQKADFQQWMSQQAMTAESRSQISYLTNTSANQQTGKQDAPVVHTSQLTKEMGDFLVQKLQLMKGNETSQATIRLHPENLGQVDIKIVTHHGQVTAQFMAETGMGKELLENQLTLLRTALIQHGLQIDKLEVNQVQQSSPSSSLTGEKGENMFQQQKHQQEQHTHFNRKGYTLYDDTELNFDEALVGQENGVNMEGIDYTV